MARKICYRRIIVSVICAFLFLLGIRRQGYGWGNTWMGANLERLIASLPGKIGPFRVDPAFRLSNVGYDSNIYFGSTGEPIADFTFRAGPDVGIYLPIKKRLVLEVREFPYYSYFHDLRNERTWNNIFRGRLHLVFQNSYLMLNKDIVDIKERLSSEVYVNIRQKVDISQGLFLWQISRALSFTLQAGRSRFEYEDTTFGTENVRSELNRTEDAGTFTAYFQKKPGARFSLTGFCGSYRFDASEFKNSRSYAISGGVEFLRTTGIQGNFSIGYRLFDLLDPQGQDVQGPIGSGRISFRVIKHTDFAVLFSRDVVFSIWSDSAYYVQDLFGGELVHSISRRIRLSYALSYGVNKYPEVLADSGSDSTSRIDDYILHSIAILFRLQRDLDLTARADVRTRTNNLGLPTDQRFFIGIDMVYRF